jgi:hypothetical protein
MPAMRKKKMLVAARRFTDDAHAAAMIGAADHAGTTNAAYDF